MPPKGRPRAASPPQNRESLSDRLGISAKQTGAPPRYSHAQKPPPSQQKSLPPKPKSAGPTSAANGSANDLMSRLGNAPKQPAASTSKANTATQPSSSGPPSLADRIEGLSSAGSAAKKGANGAPDQAQNGDSRWSANKSQSVTPVGGKPGSSKAAAAKQAAAADDRPASRASANSKRSRADQAQDSPVPSSSRPRTRLEDRISSSTIDLTNDPSSPAVMPRKQPPSRSRSNTPAGQPSAANGRASPARAVGPSLLSRLGTQTGSPARSRQSSVGSDMDISMASSDMFRSSPPPASTMVMRIHATASNRGQAPRSSPGPATSQGSTPQTAPSQSASGSVAASTSADPSVRANRPAYTEKPAFDPANRPGPQSIPGRRPAYLDKSAAPILRELSPAATSAMSTPAASERRRSPAAAAQPSDPPVQPAARAAESRQSPAQSLEPNSRPIVPPVAPRAMLASNPTASSSALSRSNSGTTAIRRDSTRARTSTPAPASVALGEASTSAPADAPRTDRAARGSTAGVTEAEAGTPPLEDPTHPSGRHSADSVPKETSRANGTTVRQSREAGTPAPANPQIVADLIASQAAASAQNGSAQNGAAVQAQKDAPRQRIKREARSPDVSDGTADIRSGNNTGGATISSALPAANGADPRGVEAAAAQARMEKLEAAKREIAELRRQDLVLEKLRREREASAKAREESQRDETEEERAQRAALLREKTEREKAEREVAARARSAKEEREEAEARAAVAAAQATSDVGASTGVGGPAELPKQQPRAQAPPTAGQIASDSTREPQRKRSASPPTAAPPAKHARREALAMGFAGEDSGSESNATSDRAQMPPPPPRADIKVLSSSRDASTGPSAAKMVASRSRGLMRRTASGSPFSTRDAGTAFQPSVAAFLASFDMALVPLAGPLVAAGFTSVVDLARFAHFEPDTRFAVLDALRTPEGDRVMLDMEAIDRLEDALVAARSAKWISPRS
ncbi:hypothetical protein JCM10908_004223 [Rhodotorula pacifica]|uniref:uncharacterized protein n=1 Tax=Rhodotorula pacifica TaxID=1495444 RepID=UPI003173B968